MKLAPDQIADVQALKDICSRPLRCPGKPMGHEDVPRTATGLPIISLDEKNPFTPQCHSSKQHLACPHVLTTDAWYERINRVMPLIANLKDSSDLKLWQDLLFIGNETAIKLDVAMRIARTGSNGENFRWDEVPDEATARKNAKKVELRFQEFCNYVETHRTKLLELIEKAMTASLSDLQALDK